MCVLTKNDATEMGVKGSLGYLGIGGVQGGVWYNRAEKGRHPYMGQNLPMKLHMPPQLL